MLAAAVLAAAVPITAHAASPSPATSSFAVRQTLTSKTELRGKVSFATPEGWEATKGGGRHSYASFRVTEGACTLDVHASMRGKATRRSARQQVPWIDGPDALGHGTRPGGAWGTLGPTLSAGEGEGLATGAYGIAAICVAHRRFGQMRVQAWVRGCDGASADAKKLVAEDGERVRQLNHVLKTAKTSLRVVRVD